MKANPESLANLRGQTKYIDDLPEFEGCLQAAFRFSESARGRIVSIDAEAAKAIDPSVIVIGPTDIPGENQVGSNKSDEPLLPTDGWEYWGQPLVLILAKTRSLARKAAAALVVRGENLPFTIDPKQAAAASDFILPSRTIKFGDPEAAFKTCAHVVSGSVDSGGQEHVYLETQGAYAERREGGKIFLISSTQGPTGVQKTVAKILGLSMNKVEVEARRLGGGFGGKEDQAATWASFAALGAWVSGKPVKLYLNRKEDMRATGKRHPYSTDFRIGADASGKILAFDADYYQNSGFCCDLSPAILSRTLLHATGTYFVPNVRVTGMMCRTNLPSFTAFRGFGAPQAFFVIEAAIDSLAKAMGKPREEIQRANLFKEGDSTHFGMILSGCRARESWDTLLAKLDWPALRAVIDAYNASERLFRKGAAILPICFGISFTKLPMNQAGALVHVYSDGSVLVSTGAIEMGQQVARKIGLVVSRALGIPLDMVSVERTSTLTVANTMPTAASTGSDLNGMAAQLACEQIHGRLVAKAAEILGVARTAIGFADAQVLVDGQPSSLGWNKLIELAHESRIDLSAHGFFATPGLFYDMNSERGTPFAYHVYGAACVIAKVDLVMGTASLESATIVHDSGTSLDKEVDLGQIEGAFAQGLGWALLEDLRFGEDGRPLTDTLSTYKLPDASFMPQRTEVAYLPPVDNPFAPFNSKAVGEPPLQYGIAAYFAVLDALRAAKPDGKDFYSVPLIPEKIEGYLSGAEPC